MSSGLEEEGDERAAVTTQLMASSGCSDSLYMDQNSSVWDWRLIAAIVYGDGTSLGSPAMVLT